MATGAFSQSKNYLDSLESVLAQRHGIDRFQPLYDLTFDYFDVNAEKALRYGSELNEVGVLSGDSLKIVRAKLAYGSALRKLERIDEALQEFLRALGIARRNSFKKEERYLLNAIAISYNGRANYEKALEYHFQSLVEREKYGSPSEVSTTLSNIGLVFYKLRNYTEAITYYEKSLTLKREFGDKRGIDRVLINIALAYNNLLDFNKARVAVQQAFEECRPNCASYVAIDGYHALGKTYLIQFSDDVTDKAVYDSAEYYFKKSYEVSVSEGNIRSQIENNVTLSELYLRAGNLPEAAEVLNAAGELVKGTSINEMKMDVYLNYSELYNRTGNFEQAAFYQKKYIALKDSLLHSRLNEIVSAHTSINERENLQTIAFKDSVIERQQSLTIAIVIIAALVALLGLVLYRNNLVKNRVNAALSEAKAIIEDQNRQLLNSNIHLDRELKERNADLEKANDSLTKANEELDNFIYKTSHDIRGPLATLKGMCNVAMLDVKDDLAISYLKKLDITAEKLNSILTRLLVVNQINSSAVGKQPIDFDQMVADIINIQMKKGLPHELKIKTKVKVSADFYSDKEFIRIVLENLIDNAVKFRSSLTRVEPFVDISIDQIGDAIFIRVVDNGIGIRQKEPGKLFQMFSRGSERSQTGGIGLYITKTAVEKLHGEIRLHTTDEGYTEFLVQLPLEVVAVPG